MNITTPILKYISENNTDYAVLIDGAWGSGKTYYLNNTLKAEIEKIHAPSSDKGEKYKLVYVSLYGVNTLAELRHKIYISTRSWAKSKLADILSKTALKAIGKKVGIEIGSSDLIDLIFSENNEHIYVFDDLERLTTKTLNEILGYINNLTEHNNIKVIIVADEEKLNLRDDDEGKRFKEIKEKLIRYTFAYKPDIEAVFDEIGKGYEKDYCDHLTTQKELILDIFRRAKYDNLRTLKFLLDIYKHVFTAIGKIEKKSKNSNDHVVTLLSQSLYFLTIASIEYKTKGPDCFDTLKQLNFIWINRAMQNMHSNFYVANQEDRLFTEEETLVTTYIRETDPAVFEYSDAMKNLIISFECGSPLEEYVTNQYRELADDDKREEINYYKKFRDFSKVEDEEWQSLIDNITKSLEEGKYSYDEAYTLFRDWEFIHKNGFKIPEVPIELFKQNIELRQKVTRYSDHYGSGYGSHIRDKSPKEEELLEFIKDKNDEKRDNDNSESIKRLFSLMTEDTAQKMNELMRTEEYKYIPIFIDSLVSPAVFFETFCKLSNSAKNHVFSALVTHRHNSELYGRNAYQVEKPFFEELIRIIDSYIKGITNKMPSDMMIQQFNVYAERQLKFINGEEL